MECELCKISIEEDSSNLVSPSLSPVASDFCPDKFPSDCFLESCIWTTLKVIFDRIDLLEAWTASDESVAVFNDYCHSMCQCIHWSSESWTYFKRGAFNYLFEWHVKKLRYFTKLFKVALSESILEDNIHEVISDEVLLSFSSIACLEALAFGAINCNLENSRVKHHIHDELLLNSWFLSENVPSTVQEWCTDYLSDLSSSSSDYLVDKCSVIELR